jgi:RNA polymerase sigma-70 factor (ECF subfamily)
VARLREGDASAFDEVYSAYRPRLYGFLTRLTKQPALADDLVQETFLRLARHAARLEADSRLEAWLFTVARNLFISQRRWALLDLARVGEARLWAKLAPPVPSPFASAAASETQSRLEVAIAALPLAYREVVLLVAVEGLAPSDAAQVMGLSAAATRQRLKRARAMILHELTRGESG